VGELLAKLGLTPQKPLQRAYQRDPGESLERQAV
jgi:transposase